MSTKALDEVLEKIELLNPEEKQQVLDALSGKATRLDSHTDRPKKKWADLVGILPYPACGEDAQEYITRSRRESERIDL